MKKKPSQETGSSETRDFTNRPFARLRQDSSPAKHSSRKPHSLPIPSKSVDRATGPGGQEEDDESLFLRAAAGARRIGAKPASAQPRTGRPPASRPDDDERQLFLAAMEKHGIASLTGFAKTEAPEQRETAPSSRMRLLKRGVIRISEELDLHGYLKDEALRRLEHFITGAHHRGRKAVLVITGKGINSPDGPVLQGAVADWLRGKGRGMVAEFDKAPRLKGGSGAFVVFLRTPMR